MRETTQTVDLSFLPAVNAGLNAVAGLLLVVGLQLIRRRRIARHRRLARVTWPIWMYVSVTGVVIYQLLYHLNTPQT